MSDRGTHFLNETISVLTDEFQVYHQKSTPYHPQANGTIKDFNKILENVLKKVCNMQRNDWDMHIPTVIQAYRKTCKKLTGQMSFKLVYGVEAVMPMEYIVPSLCIVVLIDMVDCEALKEWITQLMELEEDQFLARFHQQVQKEHENAWHDRHIKLHTFKVNDLVLLYDNKFTKFPGKFQMHWLRPYIVKEITEGGIVELAKLNGEPFLGSVNGQAEAVYGGSCAMTMEVGQSQYSRQSQGSAGIQTTLPDLKDMAVTRLRKNC